MNSREEGGGIGSIGLPVLWPRRHRHTELISVLAMLMSRMGEERRIKWTVPWSWGTERQHT